MTIKNCKKCRHYGSSEANFQCIGCNRELSNFMRPFGYYLKLNLIYQLSLCFLAWVILMVAMKLLWS